MVLHYSELLLEEMPRSFHMVKITFLQVTYFKGSAYLAQSPQLYKQMAIAADFDRVSFYYGCVTFVLF